MNNVVGLVLVCQCCDKYFVICKSCYRGHKYCSLDCKLTGYESRRKTARQKFENTFEEKLDHADRQARYRERQKVTDKSSKLNIKNVIENIENMEIDSKIDLETDLLETSNFINNLNDKKIHLMLIYTSKKTIEYKELEEKIILMMQRLSIETSH